MADEEDVAIVEAQAEAAVDIAEVQAEAAVAIAEAQAEAQVEAAEALAEQTGGLEATVAQLAERVSAHDGWMASHEERHNTEMTELRTLLERPEPEPEAMQDEQEEAVADLAAEQAVAELATEPEAEPEAELEPQGRRHLPPPRTHYEAMQRRHGLRHRYG